MPLHGLGVAAWQDEGRADARAGQMAPKIQADLVRWSLGALGRVPRFAQRRVILVFCPTLASSCHQISIGVLSGSVARIFANSEGKFF